MTLISHITLKNAVDTEYTKKYSSLIILEVKKMADITIDTSNVMIAETVQTSAQWKF